MSALGEKTNRIPDNSEQILQIREDPKTSFQAYTFERQLRSTEDIGQFHTNHYIVAFLLSFFSWSQIKFVFSEKFSLWHISFYLQHKTLKRRQRHSKGKLIIEIMCWLWEFFHSNEVMLSKFLLSLHILCSKGYWSYKVLLENDIVRWS